MSPDIDVVDADRLRKMNVDSDLACRLVPVIADDLPANLGDIRIADDGSPDAVMEMKRAALVARREISFRL